MRLILFCFLHMLYQFATSLVQRRLSADDATHSVLIWSARSGQVLRFDTGISGDVISSPTIVATFFSSRLVSSSLLIWSVSSGIDDKSVLLFQNEAPIYRLVCTALSLSSSPTIFLVPPPTLFVSAKRKTFPLLTPDKLVRVSRLKTWNWKIELIRLSSCAIKFVGSERTTIWKLEEL